MNLQIEREMLIMMTTYKLNQEVKVEMVSGFELEGKVVDFTSAGDIWVERHSDKDWLLVSPDVDHITIIEQEQERTPECLKTFKELKSAIADELKGQWYEEIESVKVAIYNADEDGVACWDCEVQIELDNGDSVYPTFGTFYNEKDALKYAREMRTKLKRTYDISEKVFVYTC